MTTSFSTSHEIAYGMSFHLEVSSNAIHSYLLFSWFFSFSRCKLFKYSRINILGHLKRQIVQIFRQRYCQQEAGEKSIPILKSFLETFHFKTTLFLETMKNIIFLAHIIQLGNY